MRCNTTAGIKRIPCQSDQPSLAEQATKIIQPVQGDETLMVWHNQTNQPILLLAIPQPSQLTSTGGLTSFCTNRTITTNKSLTQISQLTNQPTSTNNDNQPQPTTSTNLNQPPPTPVGEPRHRLDVGLAPAPQKALRLAFAHQGEGAATETGAEGGGPKGAQAPGLAAE